jgi:hypothetical protein
MFRLLGILLASFLWAGSVRTLRFLPKAYVTASTGDRAGAIYALDLSNPPICPLPQVRFKPNITLRRAKVPSFLLLVRMLSW